VAVHVRRVGVHTPQVLVHELYFLPQCFVLLLRFACVSAVLLHSLQFRGEVVLIDLNLADVVDGFLEVSRCTRLVRTKYYTFRKNLPLARLRTAIRGYGFVQVFEKVLHLASALALS